MTFLIAGLILFLVPHSLPIFARAWRVEKKASIGVKQYARLYSLVSLLGLAFVVWGYGMTRVNPVFVWNPPAALNHLAALLTLPAFILLVAAYIPANHIKLRLGHPMVLGVKVWALAHLLANGRLGDIVLFGAFLIWSVMFFASARRYDRANPAISVDQAKPVATMIAVVSGVVVWAVFAILLHSRLIGVSPFGG